MTIEFFRGGSGGRVGGGSPGGRFGGMSPGRVSYGRVGSPIRIGSPVRVGYGPRGWRGPRGPGGWGWRGPRGPGGWGWRRPYGQVWGRCQGPYCPSLYGYDITSFPDDLGDVEYIVDGEVDTTGMDCQQLDEDNIICYQSTMPAP